MIRTPSKPWTFATSWSLTCFASKLVQYRYRFQTFQGALMHCLSWLPCGSRLTSGFGGLPAQGSRVPMLSNFFQQVEIRNAERYRKIRFSVVIRWEFVSSWLFLTIYIQYKLGQAIFSLCARWAAGFKQAESMAGWHTVPFQTKVCNFCCLTTIVAANILDIYWQNRIFHQFSIQHFHIYCYNPCNPCSYLQLKESM